MVQSWNRTVYMVQSWNKEDKKQDDKGWILCFLSNKEEKKQDDKKMNFFASYLKKNSTPLQSTLINYYQDEERNANVDDYPSVHTILWQSFGE